MWGFPYRHYSGDFFHVVGEFQNVCEENIELEKVEATYYDAKGAVIEVPKLWVLWFEILAPGQKAPFATVLLDENASKKVASYKVSVVYEATKEEPYRDLKVLSHSLYDEADPIRRGYRSGVVGEVQNTGVENNENIKVFATVYDETGIVIGWVSEEVKISVLVPGQKSPFEVPLNYTLYGYFPKDILERMSIYQLYIKCSVSDKIPYAREGASVDHR